MGSLYLPESGALPLWTTNIMPKINKKKYGYGDGYMTVRCIHCRRKNEYYFVSHLEDRPLMKDNKVVIPLQLKTVEVFDVTPPDMCERCKKLPRCKDCDIIMCGWDKHYHSHQSSENPKYCDYCWVFRISGLSTD